MIRILLTIFSVCTLAAGDAPPTAAAKTDQIYRTYLAALAKAYQAETAKFDTQMKREATAAKRDPDLLAAITALQEKVKAGKQLDDLAKLISGDMLGADRITGTGEAAVIGAWDISTVRYGDQKQWTIDLKPDHTAVETLVTGTTRATNTYKWALKGSQVTITIADSAFCLRQWIIDLPLPLDGMQIRETYTGRGASKGTTNTVDLKAARRTEAAK